MGWDRLAALAEKQLKIKWLEGRNRLNTEELYEICDMVGAPDGYLKKNLIKVLAARKIISSDGAAWKLMFSDLRVGNDEVQNS